MKRVYYPYSEFVVDLQKLVEQMDSYKPDAIVAISRGGLTMAHLLSEYFSLRSLFAINAVLYEGATKLENVRVFNAPDLTGYTNILIVDEIADSGQTLTAVTELLKSNHPDATYKTATLFQKQSAKFRADWFAKEAVEWIDFFWSVDLTAEN